MNTDGLTQDQISQLEAQADQIRAENERAKRWPREGDEVCMLHEWGSVVNVRYGFDWCNELDQGNVFRTREEAEAEGRYREMRQKAREAFVVPPEGGVYINVLWGSATHYLWGSKHIGAASLGLAFNDTPEGRALAQEALAVYQGSIFKEWHR